MKRYSPTFSIRTARSKSDGPVIQVETKDGRALLGLIQSETSDAIELRMPGGQSEVIQRTGISKISSSGLSLMPVGLEGAISHREMADLLAFLKQ